MGKIKLFLGASLLLLISAQVSAAIISVGYLSTETNGTSDVIHDSLNDREWLRWDVLSDLTYAQTLDAITTGSFSDFSIATQDDAALFMEAAGGQGACIDPTNNTSVQCSKSNIVVGSESIFGDSDDMVSDSTWFISTDLDGSNVGKITHRYFEPTMNINWEGLITIEETDEFSEEGRFENTVGWLLYRDIPTPSPIPEPSALLLFLTGLIGLGIVRRKAEGKWHG